MRKAELYGSRLLSHLSIRVVSREPRRSVCPIHAETHAYWIIAAGSDPFPPQPDFTIADRSLVRRLDFPMKYTRLVKTSLQIFKKL